MFRQCVYSTALTGETADMVFGERIGGCAYTGDETFLATMRALLDTRMPSDDVITLRFNSYSVGRNIADDEELEFITDVPNKGGTYTVRDIRVNSEKSGHVFGLIQRRLSELHPEFKELEIVREFYKGSFEVLCFLNREKKSVLMFVANMNMRKYHYLQCAILASLPWYFDPKKGITDDERSLIDALQDKDNPEAYIAAVTKIAERYDFNTYRVKALLSNIETEYERHELDVVNSEISRIDSELEELNARYADINRLRRDKCIRRIGLRESIDRGPSGDSDIMSYFIRNKHLYLESVNGISITFSVHDYMTYFDEESIGSYLRNKSGYIYRYAGPKFTKDNIEKLMRAIFVDGTLKLRVCASFRITLNGRVQAMRHADFKDFGGEFLSCMPNPHINNYACMGGYERKVNEALVNGNYIMAIEQCIASTKSLNFHDDTVILAFMERLCNGDAGSEEKYIELPDGNIVSPVEALDWINSNTVVA